MRRYVKIGQTYAPRGLYIYSSSTDVNRKRNPEPQPLDVFPFGNPVLAFDFWLSPVQARQTKMDHRR